MIAIKVELLYNNLSLKLRYDFSDGDKDKDPEFQKELAWHIYFGIMEYIS